MLSSILTMAHNALLYSGRALAPSHQQSVPLVGSSAEEEENLYLIEAVEEKEGSSESLSSTDKFKESLIALLKENGLSRSKGPAEIARAAEAAQAVVDAVKETDGSEAASRMKAVILTSASGENAEGLLAAAVESYVAGKAIELATESNNKTRELQEEKKKKDEELRLKASREEIAKKAEEKVEREAEQRVAEEAGKTERDAQIAKEEDKIDLVATIKSTIEDVKRLAFGSDDVTMGVSELIPILNKVKADLAQGVGTNFSDYKALEEEQTEAQNNYYQKASGRFLAYGARQPAPGSLLSLRV